MQIENCKLQIANFYDIEEVVQAQGEGLELSKILGRSIVTAKVRAKFARLPPENFQFSIFNLQSGKLKLSIEDCQRPILATIENGKCSMLNTQC